MMLKVQVGTKHFTTDSMAESSKLLVGSYGLYLIAREDEIIAIRNIQTVVSSQYAGDLHAILAAKLQLSQRMTHPTGIHGDVEVCHMNITI